MSTKTKPRQTSGGVPILSTLDPQDLINTADDVRRRAVQLGLLLAGIVLPVRKLGPSPHVSLAELEAAWALADDLMDEVNALQLALGTDAAEVAA